MCLAMNCRRASKIDQRHDSCRIIPQDVVFFDVVVDNIAFVELMQRLRSRSA
jgi:hypothetical protein